MRIRRSKTGLSLIELLAVIAIISVLASLLLVRISKAQASAKDKVWRIEAYNFHGYIREHLLKYYQSQSNYPALSAQDLYQRGVFDSRIMDFLQCPHVQYIPFSSTDPDTKYVLTIDNNWVFKTTPVPGHNDELVLTKKHATHPGP